MRVLVTGGAGFVGRKLVELLHSSGIEPVVLDNLEASVHGEKPTPPKLPGRWIRGDVRSPSDLREALKGVSVVCHLAAMCGIARSQYAPADYCDANLRGTGALLQAMSESRRRPSRIVLAASMSAYGEGAYECLRCPEWLGRRIRPAPRDPRHIAAYGFEHPCPWCRRPLSPARLREEDELRPTSVYAASKAAQELLVRPWGIANGVETLCLRLFNVVGPGQSMSNPYTGVAAIFAAALKEGKRPVVFEDGLQTRDFVPVSLAAEAFARAVRAPSGLGHETVNVGTGVGTSVLELVRILAEEMCRPEIKPRLTGQMRSGDVRHAVADRSRMESLLGILDLPSPAEALSELARLALKTTSRSDQGTAFRELESRSLLAKGGDREGHR